MPLLFFLIHFRSDSLTEARLIVSNGPVEKPMNFTPPALKQNLSFLNTSLKASRRSGHLAS